MVVRIVSSFARERDGATMVEMTLVITLLLVVVLGFVDFGNALYQWNQASKAVQVGARLAAVSAPVASNLAVLVDGLNAGETPGNASQPYEFRCNDDQAGLLGDCSNGATYDLDNLKWIICGSGGDCEPPYYDDCGPPHDEGARRGMCDIFPRIRPENVSVEYKYSGLGYAFRPGGPVPTIVVRLQNLNFEFFFLGDLLGFGQLQIPAMTGTITGEDLCHTAC